MPPKRFNVAGAMFDVRPMNESGHVDVGKISDLPSIIDLSTKNKGRSFYIREWEDGGEQIIAVSNTSPKINMTNRRVGGSPLNELETLLNDNYNTEAELTNIGGSISNWSVDLRPRRKPIINRNFYKLENVIDDNFENILREIRKPLPIDREQYQIVEAVAEDYPLGPADLEPVKSEQIDLFYNKNQSEIAEFEDKSILKKFSSNKFIKFGLVALVVIIVIAGVGKYGFGVRNEVVKDGNSAVKNLETAKNELVNFNFSGASSSFIKAYNEFSKASDNLNFMGASIGSLLADLPGAGKLKSANNLIEAGKLIADAGKSMSEAVNAISKTAIILNPTLVSQSSIFNIMASLKNALVLANKNIKGASELLAEVDVSVIPEEKKELFNEFNSKLPLFEKLISDSTDYAKFLENLVSIKGSRKYLFLFQNPAELRPTGGFPGSYAVISFEDGKLKEFKVDDVYNLDGQIKENIIPPIQMQHITPNWAMRDANWFIDFPTSAKKVLSFFKKEAGYDVDGVITFSPKIISEILKIIGPIDMPSYGLQINSDNFATTIQNEVEYGKNRVQPKQILVDMAPIMLKKIYSANSDQWLSIFNILVASTERKDILMYFKDLNLQSFAVEKGFGGHVKKPDANDYLTVNLTNIKGSKTDTVIDTSLKVETNFSSDGLTHKVIITRKHNGGSMKYGFFNKQSPTYVRVLVPEGSQLTDISGNSSPTFKPLIDYSKLGFKKDEDLSKLESSTFFDKEKGVSIYRESEKTGFGFWMIVDPGESKTIELTYTVPPQFAKSDYALYIQKQPGLDIGNFEYKVTKPGNSEIVDSSPSLTKINSSYFMASDFENDMLLKLTLK